MPKLKPFFDISEDSDFSIYNLPYGIFSESKNKNPRIGVAIGDLVLDLSKVANMGYFDKITSDRNVFKKDTLNPFIALGKSKTKAVRKQIQKLLSDENSPLKGKRNIFFKQSKVKMYLPVEVGDYTDFYSSIEHATNLGIMFRGPENALMPNWRHLPVGYHGRASSIVVSGTNLRRPKGQVMPKGADKPKFQASARLDFELEMAFIIGKENKLGSPISVKQAPSYIFGMVIFNDWSARDIQKWEYVPLGPFLGKNFGSTVSPWVVTMEALAPFKVEGPKQKPKVLPYLERQGNQNYDIQLEVALQPKGGEETVISNSNYKYMYWDMAQQLAHHTVNGCNVKIGDMMASGTISGKDETSYGSMLELSKNGTKEFEMKDGSRRTFVEDNDTVIMRAYAEKDGKRVGFGEVKSTILPAK